MARRSPRSRGNRKSAKPARVPGTGRPRATPGRRSAARARPAPKPHAPKGARAPRPAKAARPARPRAAARAPRRRFVPPEPARVALLLELLDRAHPGTRIELDFGTPFQLLVATILSAQCTDERVNKVTPGLFARFPDPPSFAGASRAELEELVRSTGFFRMKARAIQEAAADIVARHGGEVPRTMEELTALRGVGRKTANVVLGNAFGIPGLVVDTHVTRLSNRLGLTDQKDAVKIEHALMAVVPRERWTIFSHWLIWHGRRVCLARKPRCSACTLAPHCPRTGVTVSQ
jgi:endonuclease-3